MPSTGVTTIPRNGSGIASKPAGSTASPNTTIASTPYNATVDDLYALQNEARPITAGGTGAAAAAAARTNLAVPGTATVNTFTATQTWSKGADVASATALTLGDDGNYFDITGTTTITSIATKGVGTVVKLHFDAALTLTHSADLVLPGGLNITTAAGDEAEFVEYTTGDWRCTNYTINSNPLVIAVRAHKEGTDQVISASTLTKVQLANTDFNTGGYFDTSTSRFTPPAGKYLLSARCYFSSGLVTGDDYQIFIYKNGASIANTILRAVNTSGQSIPVTDVVEANGTDYFEVYVTAGGAGNKTISGTKSQTVFIAGGLK